MITASISGSSIISSSESAFSLFEKSAYGEKKAGKVIYSPEEAIYLSEIGKMQIFSNSKIMSNDSLIKKFKKNNKNIELSSAVYSDLRNKGYLPKTALKFGADFRLYDKGERPGSSHAPWLVCISSSTDKLNWHELAGKSRIAHSTKKKLLFAVVDSESSVTYYEIDWKKI